MISKGQGFNEDDLAAFLGVEKVEIIKDEFTTKHFIRVRRQSHIAVFSIGSVLWMKLNSLDVAVFREALNELFQMVNGYFNPLRERVEPEQEQLSIETKRETIEI